MQIRNALASAIAGGLILAPGLASAADFGPVYDDSAPIAEYNANTDLPAVSGINGKLGVLGGWKGDELFDDRLFALQGSLSGPIAHNFGFQLDGIAGSMDGDFMAGVGGHLFWRDPSRGLLGVYGSFTHFDAGDVNSGRLGAEAALYYGNLTLEGTAGWESTSLPAPFSDKDNFYMASRLAYYFNSDFEGYVGFRYESEIPMGVVGFEYQVPTAAISGFSVFGEGRVGSDDFASIWVGVRKYFGGDKSLIRRHREDDPVHWIWVGGTSALASACHSALEEYMVVERSGVPGPANAEVELPKELYDEEDYYDALASVCPNFHEMESEYPYNPYPDQT